jgi:hypothetical protein
MGLVLCADQIDAALDWLSPVIGRNAALFLQDFPRLVELAAIAVAAAGIVIAVRFVRQQLRQRAMPAGADDLAPPTAIAL